MKLYTLLETILKSESHTKQLQLLDNQGDLMLNKIHDLVDKTDENLIGLLLENQELREKFFSSLTPKGGKTIFVFKTNDFKFFLDENKIDNSYTQYENRIGLTAGGKFLQDSSDVVLDFPYKDCILEGGQSTEEGTDTYFEYDANDNHYQEKQAKRKEIFFNTILAKDEIDRLLEPKAFANIKRYTTNGEETITSFNRDENGIIKDNLIIKGNNLLALNSLKSEFAGKVKLIYIDPPYNTGNDSFAYNDNFNHSTWLTFMRNRLMIAKELLREDGAIFIQCDDNEQAYLKVLCDGIFKRENFVKTIHVQMSIVQGEKVKAAKEGRIVKNGEYIHIYCNNGSNKIGIEPLYELSSYDTHYSIYIDDDNIESSLTEFCLKNESIKNLLMLSNIIIDKGTKTSISIKDIARAYEELAKFRDFIHSISSNIVRTHTMIEIENIDIDSLKAGKIYEYNHKNGRKYFYGLDGNNKIVQKLLLYDKLKQCDDYYGTIGLSTLRGDWWSGFHIDLGNINKESNVHLDNGQKPERLLENIIKLTTKKSDLVMDFHLGSGTTAAVAHKMNRQYVVLEQIDNQIDLSIKRLQNVIQGDNNNISKKHNWQGGGSFVYLELAKNNQNAIEYIQSCESYEALVAFFDEMCSKYFLHYNVKVKEFKEIICKEENFKKLTLNQQKIMFAKMLDMNQLYVNVSDMKDSRFGLSENDIAITKDFYQL